MAFGRFRCNAPPPGSVVAGRMIEFGQEFTVADSEPPRAMWIPLDAVAKEMFRKWNADSVPRLVEEDVRKKRLTGADAAAHREKLTAKMQRIPNEPIAVEEKLPDAEIAQAQALLAQLQEKRAELVARRLPGEAIEVAPPPVAAFAAKKRTADQ